MHDEIGIMRGVVDIKYASCQVRGNVMRHEIVFARRTDDQDIEWAGFLLSLTCAVLDDSCIWNSWRGIELMICLSFLYFVCSSHRWW